MMRKYWILSLLLFFSIAKAYPDNMISKYNVSEQQPTQNRKAKYPSKTASGQITDSDAFVRIVSTKTSIFADQTIDVTYRLYTKYNIKSTGNLNLPGYEGFEASDISQPQLAKMRKEAYNGQTYYIVDIYKVRLKPKSTGEIEIKPLTIDVDFTVKTGQKIESMFGKQDVYKTITKTVKAKSLVVKVSDRN